MPLFNTYTTGVEIVLRNGEALDGSKVLTVLLS